MDQISEHLVAIGLGTVAFIVLVVVVGARIRAGSIDLAGLFRGKVEGRRGATVSRVDVDGEDNKLGARGAEATVERTEVRGKRNEVRADT